ncbi:MAG TPA: hypothetical protein GX714_05325 [Chloroflexi bacterium]|jgi:hypothetical protein|nr:hypothetical protein [Chloroflexota bacterium]
MKRLLTCLVLFLSIWLLLAGFSAAEAQGPRAPMAASSTLILDVNVQPDGKWSLAFGGLDLGIDSDSFDSLSQRLGLGVMAPVVQPEMVSVAVTNDIQHLSLVKEGDRTTILVNSQPVAALSLTDAAITAAGEYLPELAGLIAWLNETNASLALHLPPKDPSILYISDLSPRVQARPAYEPVNYLRVEATMSPQGKLLTVGGMAAEELGLVMDAVDISVLNQLGITQLDIDLDAFGAIISANGQEWLQLDINSDYLIDNADTLANLLAMQPNEQINGLIETWLDGTHISASVYIADASRDAPPAINIGRPLMVEVGADNAVRVEGMPINTVLDDQTAGLLRTLGSAALTWDGANRQLRLVAGDTQLPYLEMDEGFLQTLNTSVLGGALPLDMAEGALGDAQLMVGISVEGGTPPNLALLDYQTLPTRGAVSVVPKLTIAPNSIAVFGEPLPLELVTQFTGLDVVNVVDPYRQAYSPGISTAGIYVGPEGLRVTINGTNARLRWDGPTRANLVDLGMKVAGTQLNLPGGLGWQLSRAAAHGAFNLFAFTEVGVEVSFTDQELPPGFLQTLAYSVLSPEPGLLPAAGGR